MGRCKGMATSTFGGGGGTKLFCSQALKPTDANMAKAIRGAVKTCCERIGFICVSRYVCFATGVLFRTRRSASHKSSNNLLAVEPETENDIAQKLFPRHHDFLRLKRSSSRQRQGFIQMINTLKRAATLGAVMTAAIFAGAAPAFSQAPTQAQRDAIK